MVGTRSKGHLRERDWWDEMLRLVCLLVGRLCCVLRSPLLPLEQFQ